MQYCLPHLRKVKGNIINDSSLVAKIAQRGAVPYVTSKGAIDAMTRAMAIDEAEHGVRVNGYVQQQLAKEMRFCFRDDSRFFQALRSVLVTDYIMELELLNHVYSERKILLVAVYFLSFCLVTLILNLFVLHNIFFNLILIQVFTRKHLDTNVGRLGNPTR